MQRSHLHRHAGLSCSAGAAAAAATPRSPPDCAAVCFAAPRTHSLPYASSAPALSALSDERVVLTEEKMQSDDCYSRTVQRLKLCAPRSKPIPVPRARPRAPMALPATPPLPDARPIVSRFLRREEARRRGESPQVDLFVEWGSAAHANPVHNPFLSTHEYSDEIVPGRPPREDAYLRRRAYFDEDEFY